jgi:hypothetical protein
MLSSARPATHSGTYKHSRYTVEAITSLRWLRQFGTQLASEDFDRIQWIVGRAIWEATA